MTSGAKTDYLKEVYQYPELQDCVNNIMDDCFRRKRKPKSQGKEGKITESRFKSVIKVLLPFMGKGRVEKETAQHYIVLDKEI